MGQSSYCVTLIPGDGIGPEVIEATRRVLEATGVRFDWDVQHAGAAVAEREGTPLPETVLDSIRANGVALKGPVTTPIGSGFRSVNVGIRKALDLYANVRPALTLPGLPGARPNVDLIVVRENTEGLYVGIEHEVIPDVAAEATRIITRRASERVIRYAFEYARRNGRREVTAVHKANILKTTSGLFLKVAREVAAQYPEIECNEMIVDNTCMQLVMRPEQFDVIVTTNLFGDIISDLCAGLVGGLGLAPGANIGKDAAIFEAVHGTAPDIAGQGKANPCALLLGAAQMLDHLGKPDDATRLRAAVVATLEAKDSLTPDLGGSGNTMSFARAIAGRV